MGRISDVISVLVLMLGGFFFGGLATSCVGPQPKFCAVSIISLLDIFLIKYSHITIFILFILASIDLIFTKKLMTPKRFWIIFLAIIIIHTGIFFAIGCSSHCTFDVERVDWQLPGLERDIAINIDRASSYGKINYEQWYLVFIDRLCFREPSTIQMYFDGQLMRESASQDISIELEEDPLCLESKDSIFRVKLEGLGDRTKISRP